MPGATADSYTIPLTTTNLNDLQVYCAISALGSATATHSTTATLTVLEDTVPPTVVSAFGEYDSGTTIQYVDVTFNKLMNVASLLSPDNYSIAGYPIAGVMLFTNNLGVGSATRVILQLNSPLTGSFTLNVKNVQSVSGIPIAANTSVAGTLDPLSSVDIGVFGAFTGATYYEGPNSYLVSSSGQDVWNVQDGFRFVYGARTNNFDVVVQVPSIVPAGGASLAGLMAREAIDPADGGSRMIAVYTSPTAAQIGMDGKAGQNVVQMSVRDTTEGHVYLPADYIGDVIRPDYPNQWLRLTRQTDGTHDLFTAYASTDKANWTWMGDFNPVISGADTPFPSVVNVGLCASADDYPPSAWQVAATFQNFGDYVERPTLTATLAATKQSLIISWNPAGGSLYSSPVLGSAAHWTLVATTNPATVTVSGPAKFFRPGP